LNLDAIVAWYGTLEISPTDAIESLLFNIAEYALLTSSADTLSYESAKLFALKPHESKTEAVMASAKLLLPESNAERASALATAFACATTSAEGAAPTAFDKASVG